jgi:hypothetical protein
VISRRWTALIFLTGTFLFAGSAAAQVPALGLLNPSSASAGSQSVYLTVYGSNFNYGAVVLWSGAALPTAFVSSNQLNATVAANYLTVAGQFAVNVQNADRSQSNALYFTVLGSPVSISTTTLSQAAVGTPYSFAFTASGGTPPYVWTIVDSLPAGFTLSPDGILAGTPQNPGDFTFTVRLADTTQAAVTRHFSLHVAPPPLSIRAEAL